MERILSGAALVERRRDLRARDLRVGFVPTMGALHEGHLSLVALARARADFVIASIFVNPKQFGPDEDFERYPRDLGRDAEQLAGAGCDALFHPDVEDFYPPGFETTVSLSNITRGLCGDHRPGHFDGVATVVAKLFNLVAPHVAVFGEKDFQQLALIRRMVADLSFDVEVVGAPIVREPDGLARSSRNVYLSTADRERARSISRGLFAARAAFESGVVDARALLDLAGAEMDGAGVRPEYLELRSSVDLTRRDRVDGPSVLLVAALVGSTRLIDNVRLDPGP